MASDIQKQIVTALAEVLKPLDYKKRRTQWTKDNKETQTFIWLQRSRWDEVYYVTFGSIINEIAPEKIPAHFAHFHFRFLEQICPEGRLLLDFSEDKDITADIDKFIQLLLDEGLQLLTLMETIAGMKSLLAKHGRNTFAIYYKARPILGTSS